MTNASETGRPTGGGTRFPAPLRLPLICLLLALGTVAAYHGVLASEFVVYDDYAYVVENEHVRRGLTLEGVRWALTATHDSNWFPLTWLSHMTDVSLFGLDSRGHHAVNLLLHLLNTTLLLIGLTRMTGQPWRSAAVAMLFALHPLHVESVAWIAERKDLLSSLFFMLSLIAYHRYASAPSIGKYLMVILVFALGLASKPMLVTLPFVLLLLDLWPLGRLHQTTLRRLVTEKIPLLALTAMSSAVTVLVQAKGGSVVDYAASSPATNIANALTSYVGYIGKTILPTELAVFYPFPERIPLWQVLAAASVLAAVTFAAARLRRGHPYLITGWLWYLGMLVPVIGIVRVGEQALADRYTYLPLIGLFLAAAWGVACLAETRRFPRAVAPILCLVVGGILAIATRQQTGHWHDSLSLFRHALAVTDDNWVAQSNLGTAFLRIGDLEPASAHFTAALRINPESHGSWMGLGLVAMNRRDFTTAAASFMRAAELKPDHAPARFHLGRALLMSGDTESALVQLKVLRDLDPPLARLFVERLPSGLRPFLN